MTSNVKCRDGERIRLILKPGFVDLVGGHVRTNSAGEHYIVGAFKPPLCFRDECCDIVVKGDDGASAQLTIWNNNIERIEYPNRVKRRQV